MGRNPLIEIRSCTSQYGTQVYFSKGKFDNWCVYLKKRGEARAPHDKSYFKSLKTLADKYGEDVIYDKNDIFKYIDMKLTCLNTTITSSVWNHGLDYWRNYEEFYIENFKQYYPLHYRNAEIYTL